MSTLNTTTPSHTEAAQALIEKVRAMQQEIPNFTFPKPGSSTQSLSKSASVPPQFVYSTAAAVQNNPVLVRGGATEPDQLRNLMEFAEAYTGLANEIEAFECGGVSWTARMPSPSLKSASSRHPSPW